MPRTFQSRIPIQVTEEKLGAWAVRAVCEPLTNAHTTRSSDSQG